MPIFDKLCCVARQAEEKSLISRKMAERICRIGLDRQHYKHLGLELHDLAAQLAQAGAGEVPVSALETMLLQIEKKYRRV